jgi:hypothetical protein
MLKDASPAFSDPMSSIAYVTDKHMIEFHRLSGNTTINFWRPSSSKRFSDFNPGDLLFFLAKGTEHPLTKEKGLIGYGRFAEAMRLSLKTMWKQYGVLNGYHSEQTLKDAILKVSKEKTLTHPISCLKLTNIVFFQSPVYLSEIGIQVPLNLESYLYLDKENPETTMRILAKANDVGIDAWTAAVSDEAPSEDVFVEDLIRHTLTLRLNQIPSHLNLTEERRSLRALTSHQENHPQAHWLDDRKHELFEFKQKTLTITWAIISEKRDVEVKFLISLGKLQTIRILTQQMSAFAGYKLQFEVLVEPEPDPQWVSLFSECAARLSQIPKRAQPEHSA